MNSCLYRGWVRHRRYSPVRHAFRYRLFQVALDLSELDTVFAGRWLWSASRPAPAWFRRADHLGDAETPLDQAVRLEVERATGAAPSGPILLVTHLRYFGYVMNPVSFYYCLDEVSRRTEHIVAEVHNTPWGERHCYVLATADGEPYGSAHRFSFPKSFHVSPFLGMRQQYRWAFSEPGDSLVVHMEAFERDRLLLDATLRMERQTIDGSSLATALATHPLMTLEVVAGIYWQAVRLYWKRCPFYSHPKHDSSPDEDPA